MKIAYVCSDPGVPVFGTKGCSLHVQEMLRAFQAFGMDTTLYARAIGGAAPADLSGIPVRALDAVAKGSAAERETALVAGNAVAAKALRSAEPFDLVYERYALWSHAPLVAARASGAVTMLEVNAPLIEEQQRFRTLHDGDAAKSSSLKVFDAADIIVAVSNEVACYLTKFRQAQGKIHVIPNGVNAERFGDAAPVRAGRTRPYTVGFVGSLKPWHGVDILIDAFAKMLGHVGDARLLIVGDGPERDRLVALCSRLDISDRVEFTGAIEPAAVPGQLARMDVGVAPYPELDDFYFSPLKVFEYLASGLPVVASDIGQLRDIVHQGCGILCEPGNEIALSDALVSLSASPQRRNQLGAAGRKRVRAEHTWLSVAERVLELAARSRAARDRQGIAQ